ncbi:reverse transcriptase domain-containing protein [Sulfurospirillum cavolei]|uniref:RNA-directed DNA polymerase n=1 Tax=Sulfurospirillum cavolei TaxID=366522 RepID=UPI003FA1F2EB
MKRVGNLFGQIIDVKNILAAHNNAKKGKRHYAEVKRFEERPYHYARNIRRSLIEKSYAPSPYVSMHICDRGKPREILKTRYYPDRIIHHALMQVVQPILEETYIKDTYQSITGRGTHKAIERVKSWMKDEVATRYCLKIDIRKFYPSVDNETLKALFRKKIKCEETLYLLDTLVDSSTGLPIGNYTSQTFANYYLSFFDHFVKEVLHVKHYARYADDMVFFSDSKEELHVKLEEIRAYLQTLKLEIKGNWQVFETRGRGFDFLGYRLFGHYTLLRKKMATKIKRAFLQPIKDLGGVSRVMSYLGWLKIANAYNFLRLLLTKNLREKIRIMAKRLRIKNPLRGFVIVSKNRAKNVQLTLF